MDICAQPIHDQIMRIHTTMGMRFKHPEALRILEANGIRVQGGKAFFTEDQLMGWVKKAPESFILRGIDPGYDISIGGDNVAFAPAYGCPFISDGRGGARPGEMADYVQLLKLYEANPDFSINGGLLVQPSDVDPAAACLVEFYAALSHSQKCQFITAGNKECMDAMMRAAQEFYGGAEQFASQPRMFTIVNVNTPCLFDETMCDTLLALASHGQVGVITSTAMAGTTAPVSLAATIAMTFAEVLPVVALAQMISPGVPVVLGCQSSGADMGTGAMASGGPEVSLIFRYAKEMSRFYGMPLRGGPVVTDSKVIDAQAGYESMFTLMNSMYTRSNLIIHAAGVLDGYMSVSPQKVVHDFELIGYAKCMERELVFDEEAVDMELIQEVGLDGEYLSQDDTLDNFRDELYVPNVSSRGNVKDPMNQMGRRLDARVEQLTRQYKKPAVDQGKLDAVKRALCEVPGVERSMLDAIDSM